MVGVEVGARERINLKWSLLQFEVEGEQKDAVVGTRSGGKGEYLCEAKVYSCSSRARGLTVYIFFFILIGFKEFRIV
jgi:hypothetical protein